MAGKKAVGRKGVLKFETPKKSSGDKKQTWWSKMTRAEKDAYPVLGINVAELALTADEP